MEPRKEACDGAGKRGGGEKLCLRSRVPTFHVVEQELRWVTKWTHA